MATVTQIETSTCAPDKLYMENTLLRVAGALFCHDAKRAAVNTDEIELNSGVAEKAIVIRPDPKLGQPGQLAHKVFVALIKKHSDYGRPVRKDISFTRREIGRLIGRSDWGGRDSEQLARALYEIHYTFIRTQFKKGDGRHIEHSFNVFSEIRIERREFASDPIEACTVTLAQPIVASLEDEHFTCLNHALMQQLGTIGQALYMRLFFHLANLYDGANTHRLTFQKRYDDICMEWLGGLTVLAHRSKIVREQLGRHLDQLVAAGFLAGYGIEKAKDKARPGFTVSFTPGPSFYADYDRFYRRRQQGSERFDPPAEAKTITEPLKVAYQFAERRTGHPAASIAFVPSKDVDTARQLLAELAADELPAFFDYSLAEAARTNFDIKTLGGTKQYLAAYLTRRSARAAEQAARAVKHTAEAEQSAFDRHRREEALRLFAALPDTEQAAIEAEARSYAASFGTGTFADMMFATRKLKLITRRYGDRLTDFGAWRAARSQKA